MMFRVDPAALRIYATHLAGLQQAAQRAKEYVNKHGTLDIHSQGLIAKAMGFHDDYVRDLNATLDHLSALLAASGGALTKSAGNYERTDMKAAAAIDAALPPTPRAVPSRD
ncbi:type VII secretion target [Actinoplanes regularis]|nr:type VII secretion target [Actinoplanes regularis]GIE89968.1 hypothetical protein Are01nite_64480 [Actinoplanes regularis]